MWSLYGAKNSIADGLAVAEVGCNAFETCDHLLEKVVSISEDWVKLISDQSVIFFEFRLPLQYSGCLKRRKQ